MKPVLARTVISAIVSAIALLLTSQFAQADTRHIINPETIPHSVALPPFNDARPFLPGCVRSVKLTVDDLPIRLYGLDNWQRAVRSAAKTWSNVGSNITVISPARVTANDRRFTPLDYAGSAIEAFPLANCEVRFVLASSLPEHAFNSVSNHDTIAGWAQIYLDPDAPQFMLAALVVLNDRAPMFSDTPKVKKLWTTVIPVPVVSVDVETIALHELGHAIGLGHNITGTVMSGSGEDHIAQWLGVPKRKLTPLDRQALLSIYGKRGKPLPITTAAPQPALQPQATIEYFTADRTTVNAGERVQFRWKVLNVKAVYFDNEPVGGEDSRERSPDRAREYVLVIVKQDDSQATRSIAISVNTPPAPVEPSIQVHVDRNPINQGECTRVSWDVDNIEAIYFDGQPVGGHDSREVCPAATRDYGLDVRWGGGRQTLQLVNIQVIAQSDKPNIRWWVDRNPINQGECTRVWWEVDNVTAVYFDGQGVAGHDSREVCPASTRDYGLDVRWGNGNQTLQLVNIQVNPAQPSAGYVKMVEPLRFELVSQDSSVTIRATFKVRNTGGSDVTIEELAAGARKGTDWNGEWFDFPHVYGITLSPGQEYVYDQMRSFDQAGHYFAEPVMKLAGASWGGIDGANRIPFDVQ